MRIEENNQQYIGVWGNKYPNVEGHDGFGQGFCTYCKMQGSDCSLMFCFMNKTWGTVWWGCNFYVFFTSHWCRKEFVYSFNPSKVLTALDKWLLESSLKNRREHLLQRAQDTLQLGNTQGTLGIMAQDGLKSCFLSHWRVIFITLF